MGDRLGIPGAVGFFFFLIFFILQQCNPQLSHHPPANPYRTLLHCYIPSLTIFLQIVILKIRLQVAVEHFINYYSVGPAGHVGKGYVSFSSTGDNGIVILS